MITDIKKSKNMFKRFEVTMDNGKKFNFGLKNGYTYIDGADEKTQENYKKRHMGNNIERHLINNLIPSPALFSYYLLWHHSRDIHKNITHLNNLWKEKHKK